MNYIIVDLEKQKYVPEMIHIILVIYHVIKLVPIDMKNKLNEFGPFPGIVYMCPLGKLCL